MTKLTIERGNLILSTPYNAGLVADLKRAISYQYRKWHPSRKVWEVDYMYGQDIIDIVARHLGETLTVPKQQTRARPVVTKLLKVEYIGAVKERDNGEFTATGYCAGEWSVIFPLLAMRQWFEGNDKPVEPGQAASFYSILGITSSATGKEIRKAHRIAAKTWHPDLNDEDTSRQFRQVQEAYETLNDPQQRRKYDAGLYLQNSIQRVSRGQRTSISDLLADKADIWRPPKRCGWLTVECEESLGRYLVKRILQWDDIVESGLIMVSYWPKRADKFETDWI